MLNWSIKNDRSYREVLHIRLPVRIKNELKRIADQRGWTLSDIIRLSLEKFLEEMQRENAEKQS
jgi:predicted DNA-binding protein